MTELSELSRRVLECHRAGRLDEAERHHLRILSLDPGSFLANHLLGTIRFRQRRFDEALALIDTALATKPDAADALANRGLVLNTLGRRTEALASYDAALSIQPAYAKAWRDRGFVLMLLERMDAAIESFEKAEVIEPGHAGSLIGLGDALMKSNHLAEAFSAFSRGLAAAPDDPAVLNRRGICAARLDRHREALDDFAKAVALKPDFAEAWSNHGGALHHLKQCEAALLSFDKALALKPDFMEAHHHRGNALRELMKLPAAAAAYERALALKPDHAEALQALGAILCETGRIEEGFAAFTRAALLVQDHRPADSPLHKLRHDQEQRDFLAAELNVRLAADMPPHLAGGGRLAGAAVNPVHRTVDPQRQWKSARPQIVVIDDFLTDQALDGLRLFCWGSTIWRKIHEDGYLGSFPEHGVACPLLAQIAAETRRAFPAIFESHPLLYFWAFKYDAQLKGIKVHADFAAINVNFWITPDEANQDPDSGGLVVWDAAAPLDWEFGKYNGREAAIRDLLDRSEAKKHVVPYRCNRAVVFDSDLFHETDAMDFRGGYRNRRINFTLLFGRRQLS